MNGVIQGVGKSKMGRYFVTALLLALAVTGGLFAYAYTSATTSLDVTAGSTDIATISANMTVPNFTLLGQHRGRIESGNLFNVTKNTGYTGDVEVIVYLDNIDELSTYYGMLMIRVQLVNDSDVPVDVEGIDKPLSLRNGAVSFVSDNMSADTTYYIKTSGGVYRTFPNLYWSGSSDEYAPSLTAEVIQAGA